MADLASQLAQADFALENALRAGTETAPIRELQAALQAEIAEQRSATARASAAVAAAAARSAQARAGERLTTLLDPLRLMPDTIGSDAVDFAGDLAAASATVESAEIEAEAFAPRLSAAREEVGNLAERILNLERKRQAIATRRLGGDFHVEDAGSVALLDLDLENLRAIHNRATSDLAEIEDESRKLEAVALEARSHLVQIETTIAVAYVVGQVRSLNALATDGVALLTRFVAGADAPSSAQILAHLVPLATAADAQLLAIADLLAETSRRAGRISKPLWGASKPLQARLRQFAAARGEL